MKIKNIMEDDEVARKLGEQLAYVLQLKFEADDKFYSYWGPLSHIGLARFVAQEVSNYAEED